MLMIIIKQNTKQIIRVFIHSLFAFSYNKPNSEPNQSEF